MLAEGIWDTISRFNLKRCLLPLLPRNFPMSEDKKSQIRNSIAEFLIFTGQAGEDSIEVRIAEETVWLTQKLMGVLFDVTTPTINEHLANLYDQKEISQAATIRNFRIVQKEGSREVSRNVEFYNLEAIAARIGFIGL